MRRFFFAALLLCPVLFISAFAQTTNATLGGTVSDATGALIPGVTVTATNTQTGIVTTKSAVPAGTIASRRKRSPKLGPAISESIRSKMASSP